MLKRFKTRAGTRIYGAMQFLESCVDNPNAPELFVALEKFFRQNYTPGGRTNKEDIMGNWPKFVKKYFANHENKQLIKEFSYGVLSKFGENHGWMSRPNISVKTRNFKRVVEQRELAGPRLGSSKAKKEKKVEPVMEPTPEPKPESKVSKGQLDQMLLSVVEDIVTRPGMSPTQMLDMIEQVLKGRK